MRMTTDTNNRELTVTTELQVNGRQVELHDFVQSFLGQAVVGAVRSLRGIGNIQQIRLAISTTSE
jgi:hypothetical protein